MESVQKCREVVRTTSDMFASIQKALEIRWKLPGHFRKFQSWGNKNPSHLTQLKLAGTSLYHIKLHVPCKIMQKSKDKHFRASCTFFSSFTPFASFLTFFFTEPPLSSFFADLGVLFLAVLAFQTERWQQKLIYIGCIMGEVNEKIFSSRWSSTVMESFYRESLCLKSKYNIYNSFNNKGNLYPSHTKGLYSSSLSLPEPALFFLLRC